LQVGVYAFNKIVLIGELAMNPRPQFSTRRQFVSGAVVAAGMRGFDLLTPTAQAADTKATPNPDLHVIGPRPGDTPEIGTLVSMLTYMQYAVFSAVRGLSQADLDYLFDANANTIGALLLHLAATETYYGMNTFENKNWDSWSDDIKKKWDPAMNLGDAGRKAIKGQDLDYYLNILNETREHSLAEFRKRDDAWLLRGETEQFGKGKVNIYWKWFHVCEHESHHTGQIAFLAKRLPGAKPVKEGA
jgi:uncharacterized damage-inducible protein DinB